LFEAKITPRWQKKYVEENRALVRSSLDLLEDAGGRAPLVEKETKTGILEFQIDGSQFLETPDGYIFKGGVARKALAQALRLNAYTRQARDMDVAFISRGLHSRSKSSTPREI